MKGQIVALVFLAGFIQPAFADDFVATCKASPPSDMPANSPADSADKFCGCVDKELAGNDKERTAFMASFKIKEMAPREAALDPVGKAAMDKCRPH